MTPKSSQEDLLRSRIDKISGGAFNELERVDSLEPAKALEVLRVVLGFCCAAQHVGAITAGRAAFDRLPRDWVSVRLEEVIRETVAISDPWEYRRLLELLRGRFDALLARYVELGSRSLDAEIIEASLDFRDD